VTKYFLLGRNLQQSSTLTSPLLVEVKLGSALI